MINTNRFGAPPDPNKTPVLLAQTGPTSSLEWYNSIKPEEQRRTEAIQQAGGTIPQLTPIDRPRGGFDPMPSVQFPGGRYSGSATQESYEQHNWPKSFPPIQVESSAPRN